MAAQGPARAGGLLLAAAGAPPEEEPDAPPVSDGDEEEADAVGLGPRRNIGQEFDDEDRAREEIGPGTDGEVEGSRGRGAWGRGRAPKGGTPELAEGGSVEDEKDGRDGDIDRGSRTPSRSSSSSSSSPQREQLQENAASGEAVGAMEGVHPGLATYDSQRAAAGMDGGGRAGQEEYARMLELMQKVKEAVTND